MTSRVYKITDFIKRHNLDAARIQFMERGRCAARFWADTYKGDADDYLNDKLIIEIITALHEYRDNENYTAVGRGMERFFARYFKRGWREVVDGVACHEVLSDE